MSDMTNLPSESCLKCGTAFPNDAPGGLCPQCVLAGAAAVTYPTGTSRIRTAPPSLEELAPHFPQLEIIKLLGVGGMGAVYQARQQQLGRTVALKILSRDLAGDPSFVERFNREARVLARLTHPNIVTIFDFGTAGPHCYLLMEDIDGVNLRQAMQAGRFSPAESLAMAEDICAALKFAHEEGVLHRDIKPENVLIDSKGRVKIADFGIAKLLGESEHNDITLTMRGSILGSPHYMSPEQIETPGDVDQRADIYSLGVVLYEMLTGELPIGRFAPPSTRVHMDARIDEIVMRTLEKDREARFQSAEEVRTSVGAVAQNPKSMRPAPADLPVDHSKSARFGLVAAILTGLSLVGVAGAISIMSDYRELGLTRETAKLIYKLLVIPSLMIAVSGFIFGLVTLGSIRKSGGALGGLGGSVFAIVVWPILMLWSLGVALIHTPMPDIDGGRHAFSTAVPLIVGATNLFSAWVLARGLRRWARGVGKKDGIRHFPGLAGTMTMALSLSVFVVLLLEVYSRHSYKPSEQTFLIASRIPGDPWAMETRTAPLAPSSWEVLDGEASDDEIEWYHGDPEVILPVEVDPALRAEFRLIRVDPLGQNLDSVEIGYLVGPLPGHPPTLSTIRIGISGPHGAGFANMHKFAAHLDIGGQSGRLPMDSEVSDWEFGSIPLEKLQLTTSKKHTIDLATRSVDVDGRGASLKLEVSVTPR